MVGVFVRRGAGQCRCCRDWPRGDFHGHDCALEILVGGDFGVLRGRLLDVKAEEMMWAENLSVPQSQWVQAVRGI